MLGFRARGAGLDRPRSETAVALRHQDGPALEAMTGEGSLAREFGHSASMSCM
jgi:hypothetical protein